ncbi:DUF4440 domain-containing protein [Paenibacillus sp. NPDC058177]|uniref:nuclear transport factor 2 family protein n=1 Tax=Paenibacillus sp. NPDC058177 TaxID=3346369 RepID=UPI0036DED7EE
MDTNATLKAHLLELEERLLQPAVRTSVEELSALLDDGFFEFGSSGAVWYRQEGLHAEGIGIVNMTLSDFEIHPLSPDTTLTTYRIFNENKQQYSLRSSIWRYREGRWQMFFHQGTPVPE